MKFICYFLPHKWVSMKDVANYRFHKCEWCERCKEIKDFNKMI